MPEINQDRVPSNFDDAVQLLYDGLSAADIEVIRDNPNNSALVHHDFGRTVRNSWSLWNKDTIFVQWCINNLGIMHADDISGMLMAALWAKVLEREFNCNKEVQWYINYWKMRGVDAATMVQVGPDLTAGKVMKINVDTNEITYEDPNP